MRNESELAIKMLIKELGETFIVERPGHIIEVRGAKADERYTRKPFISFLPDSDIRIGDWITGKSSGNRFYIEDTSIDSANDQPFQLKAFYITKAEFDKKSQPQQPTFHINNAYGSVIGTQSNATVNNNYAFDDVNKAIDEHGGPDKEELYKIVKDLQNQLEKGSLPKGFLAKSASFLDKHTWLPSMLSQIILAFIKRP